MSLFAALIIGVTSISYAQSSPQLDHCNQELPKLAEKDKSLLRRLNTIDRVAKDDLKKFQTTSQALKASKPELDRLSKEPESTGNNYDIVINGYYVKDYENEMDPKAQGSVGDNIQEYLEDKAIAGEFVNASFKGNFAQAGEEVASRRKAPNFFKAIQNSNNVAAETEMHLYRNRIGSLADGARNTRASRNTYLGNFERGRWKLEEVRVRFEEILKRKHILESPVYRPLLALREHYRVAERVIKESIEVFTELGAVHREKAVCMRAIKDAGQSLEERMKTISN